MCAACYKIEDVSDRQEALNKAKKVVTYCSGCVNNPFYCLNCFNCDHQV